MAEIGNIKNDSKGREIFVFIIYSSMLYIYIDIYLLQQRVFFSLEEVRS